jgi:hypothetical protein
MSKFQVQLKSAVEGTMDVATEVVVTAGYANYNASLQRQAYVMGPKRINRLMVDGDVFDDCNYFKRFCPYNATTNPQGCDPVAAILVCLLDDGSPYSDVPAEQTFAYSTAVAAAVSPLWATVADFATLYGSYAVSAIIKNTGAAVVTVCINGSGVTYPATFTLAAGATQVFDFGDVVISKIEAKSVAGGESVTVFAGVKSVSNS